LSHLKRVAYSWRFFRFLYKHLLYFEIKLWFLPVDMAMVSDNLKQALEQLEAQYNAALPDEIASLEKAYKVMRISWNPILFKALHHTVHRLAGEGATYGYEAMGAAAKELDVVLGRIAQGGREPNNEEMNVIGEHLETIKHASRKNAETPPPHSPEKPKVVPVDQATSEAPSDASKPSEPPDTSDAPLSPASTPSTSESTNKAPVYLALPEHDKKLGSYLMLQWLQVEANWKALQWAWDQDTFAILANQLQALLENAATFQFMALHDTAQHTDKCIREIRQEGNEPTGFQLANLTQQIQELSLVAVPLGEYEYHNKHALGRMPHARKLRIALHENTVNPYLVLQMQALEDLWQTLQWNWHSESLLQLQDYLSVLQKNCEKFSDPDTVVSVKNFHDVFKTFALTGRVPDEAELAKLNKAIAKIKQAWKRLQADSEQAVTLDNGKKLIYVVEDDEYFAKYLDVQLEMAGYSVKIFNRLLGLAEAIKNQPPAVLLVDIVLTEGDLAGPRAMFQIQKGRPRPLPVIFMSARSDLRARLAAARAHGDAYLTKPLDIELVLATLEDLTRPPLPEPQYQILLVDNVKNSGMVEYAKILREAKIDVKLLNEPGRFLDAMSKLKPNLVLLNAHMNNVSGVELATVARQQKTYDDIPIIFYGMRFDQTWQIPVQRGIGDDFLGENIPPGQLLATIMKYLKTKKKSAPKQEESK
jgi:DNA-binding response OmpR family regulator